MIHDGPYPEGDERHGREVWTEVPLPLLPTRLKEALHEALANSTLLEAHHGGGGMPILAYRNARGEMIGDCIYIRVVKEEHGLGR